MFQRGKLNRQIKKCRKQIEEIEHRRARSQAALVEAILSHRTPMDEDVDFFNRYTAEIDAVRAQMQELQVQVDHLNDRR